MRFLFLALFICSKLLAVDFDVVVVGTSPICLLEALYQYHSGKRVLILEKCAECGGSWKTIPICGVAHADLGCHLLGSDPKMLHFLQDYVGCKMVSMDNPHEPFNPEKPSLGFYPSLGCYEIIHNLLQLVERTQIVLLLNHHLDSVFISEYEPIATVKTNDKEFTTSKIIVTPFSDIAVNPAPANLRKYTHLYLLIEDPTMPTFTYRNGITGSVSRMMNLTYFVGLEGSGKQLIVLQIHRQDKEDFIELMKRNHLIDQSAKLISSEYHFYEQGTYPSSQMQKIKNASAVFELIHTHSIQDLVSHIPRWQMVLKPFHQALLATCGM